MPTPPPLPATRLLLHAGLACALLVSALAAQPAVSPALEKFAAARNLGLPALAFDFTRATVVAPAAATGPEKKAVAMLLEETESRTLVRWPLAATLPAAQPAIVVGRFAEVRTLLGARVGEAALDETKVGAEGYQLVTLGGAGSAAPVVVIAGRDARGVLFGVGHLLRTLNLGPARAGLMAALNLTTSPRYALRGHQLAYRPKPNSYSGWDLPQWERYIRELTVFGCNAIELLPPRTDAAAQEKLPDSGGCVREQGLLIPAP